MKIAFLLASADEMGGTERAVATQAANLAERHEVQVLSVYRTAAKPFFPAGPKVRTVHLVDRTTADERPVRRTTLSDGECRTLAALGSRFATRVWEFGLTRLADVELEYALGSLDADVLVTTTPDLMAAAVALVPAEVVVVHQEHRASEFRGPSGDNLLSAVPRVDAVVTLTQRTREWFEESLGQAAPRLEAIPNPAPGGFRPRSSTASRTIVVAGRLVAEKQLDQAVAAFAKAVVDHPGWRLRILGDGPHRNRLKRQVDELALHDSVEILGSTQAMTEEWAKAAVCLLTSRVEAFGLVMLEAFAAGVPVVAYDSGTGPAEIVRHEVDGLLVPAGDVDSLALALGRLMGDEELRRRMGGNAVQGLDRFSEERITGRWETLLTELVAGRRAPERRQAALERAARRIAAAGPGAFHPTASAERLAPSTGNQAEREKQLMASRPDLVRSGGRLAEVRSDLAAPQAGRMNLDLVADALEGSGIPYVLLRHSEAHPRVAVDAVRREDALRALSHACAGEAVYAEPVGVTDRSPSPVLAERLEEFADVAGVRVFRPVVTPSRTLRYGPSSGCDVEFWPRDPGTGAFTASVSATLVGAELPSLTPEAVLEEGERSRPTAAVFGERLMSDVDFPVDVVYTWVNDTDPAWRARMAAARAEQGLPEDCTGGAPERFRNRDELRFSLRSLAMYAPWVRRIHLVTDDQVPAWLDTEHPDIRVVPHHAVFNDPSLLPTFNSHAIETQLHRIDGLAEHFLYFNDDVFLGRPLRPEDFFLSNGSSLFFRTSTHIPLSPPSEEEDGYFAAARNNRELIRAEFGRTITHGFGHTPHALRRSVLQQLTEVFPEAVARTAASRFRSPSDISMTSSLHHHYGYLTGSAVPGSIRSSYVNVGLYEHHSKLTALLTRRNSDVFCLNESSEGDLPEPDQARIMQAFMQAYFPVPSPYER